MTVVLDASLIVAVIVADDRQKLVENHLRGWLSSGEELHAPGVLPYEVANVLARLVFDRTLEPVEIRGIWVDLAALGLVLHPFDLLRDGAEIAAVTARMRRRHATDSAYICLAQRLRATVWTLDVSLARNAYDLGLPVRLVA